jgi:hypothetical protein
VAVEHQLQQQQSSPLSTKILTFKSISLSNVNNFFSRMRNSISNELRKTGQLRETAILLSFIMP